MMRTIAMLVLVVTSAAGGCRRDGRGDATPVVTGEGDAPPTTVTAGGGGPGIAEAPGDASPAFDRLTRAAEAGPARTPPRCSEACCGPDERTPDPSGAVECCFCEPLD